MKIFAVGKGAAGRGKAVAAKALGTWKADLLRTMRELRIRGTQDRMAPEYTVISVPIQERPLGFGATP